MPATTINKTKEKEYTREKTSTLDASIIESYIFQKRISPRKKEYITRLPYFLISMDSINDIKSSLFSYNYFNLFSIYKKEFKTKKWIQNLLEGNGARKTNGKISILIIPRFLGIIHNPIIFWFCFDNNDGLRAVIIKIKNKNNQEEVYIVNRKDQKVIGNNDEIIANKICEFNDKKEYLFKFNISRKLIEIEVQLYKSKNKILETKLYGRRKILTTNNLLITTFLYPFYNLKTFLKKIRFF